MVAITSEEGITSMQFNVGDEVIINYSKRDYPQGHHLNGQLGVIQNILPDIGGDVAIIECYSKSIYTWSNHHIYCSDLLLSIPTVLIEEPDESIYDDLI